MEIIGLPKRYTNGNQLFNISLLAAAVGKFSPESLFRNGEQGVYYDPSDLNTLYQDSAGTTPVTAAGQPVGLMLDKSKGLELGPEMIVDPEFDNPSDWYGQGSWVIAGGVATSGATAAYLYPLGTAAINGGTYEMDITVDARYTILRGGVYTEQVVLGVGTHKVYMRTVDTVLPLYSIGAGNVLSHYSAKLLAGNHASQPTAGKRPILMQSPAGGVRNLLTYTEDFTNAAWNRGSCTVSGNKVIPNNAAASSGIFYNTTGLPSTAYSWSILLKQAELSNVRVRINARTAANAFITDLYVDVNLAAGTIGSVVGGTFTGTSASISAEADGYYRVTVSGTSPATTGILWCYTQYIPAGDGVSGWLVDEAQLELGSTATPYQKVTNRYTVTEEGKASCWSLKFDGIDDFMSTAAINFSGTDKVSLWSGFGQQVAGLGFLAELSASASLNAGSFNYLADGVGTGRPIAGYKGAAGGGDKRNTSIQLNVAPYTLTATAAYDLSGASVNQCVPTYQQNAVNIAASEIGAIAGGGNFASYPLYIGCRGGITYFLNGNIYPLVIAGALYDANTVAKANAWTAKKTGVVL